jgi:hypothetical protein
VRDDIRGGEVAAVRLAGGAPVPTVLAVDDPWAWISLDAGVREVAGYRAADLPTWQHAAPLTADAAQLDESRTALALCHRDGRIRERAVGWSVRYPGLLPLIVIRCADWVAPVRERARQLLREALDADTAVALAPLIVLVGRRDRGAFAVDLLDGILRRAPGERLAPLLTAADRTVRRFVHRLAVAEQLLSPAELARTAAHDDDAVLQDLCAEAALAAVAGDTSGGVVETLLRARNPRARSAGVTALRRAGRPAEAERFLVDRSALVRACARYVVRHHGTDPLPLYRAWCSAPEDPALPPGAVIGLAECGGRADAEALRPLLTHPAPGVRARAVAGLRVLDVTDERWLRTLLDDPAPGVVRETALALLPVAERLPVDWLTERLQAERPRHVRVAAFRLLDARGGIVRLRTAVGLLDDPDVKLRRWAGQSVQRWRPSAEVPRGDPEVEALLDRGAHLFSAYVLRRRKWEAGLPVRDAR